jgi:3'-phosphoadenosine 5'-phosphosulfate sulfotransferase (PAPS reductase)/FAD synthetase
MPTNKAIEELIEQYARIIWQNDYDKENSPVVITWNILPDWAKEYYLKVSRELLALNKNVYLFTGQPKMEDIEVICKDTGLDFYEYHNFITDIRREYGKYYLDIADYLKGR